MLSIAIITTAPKSFVDEQLDNGYNVFLEIELQGAKNVLSMRPDAVSIFILPPTLEELERRLRDRGTETEEAIAKRLSQAKVEMENAKMYQYTVVNDDLEKAISDVLDIVSKETC